MSVPAVARHYPGPAQREALHRPPGQVGDDLHPQRRQLDHHLAAHGRGRRCGGGGQEDIGGGGTDGGGSGAGSGGGEEEGGEEPAGLQETLRPSM